VSAGHNIKQRKTDMVGSHTRHPTLQYMKFFTKSVIEQSSSQTGFQMFFLKNESLIEVSCICEHKIKQGGKKWWDPILENPPYTICNF